MRTEQIIALSCLLFGCNSTVSSLRTRFATEKGCSESQVDVTASGGTEYRATGCKQSAVYVCAHSSMSATDVRGCAEQDLRAPRNPPERQPQLLPPPDPRVQMP